MDAELVEFADEMSTSQSVARHLHISVFQMILYYRQTHGTKVGEVLAPKVANRNAAGLYSVRLLGTMIWQVF